jgi:hypothetical protein
LILVPDVGNFAIAIAVNNANAIAFAASGLAVTVCITGDFRPAALTCTLAF